MGGLETRSASSSEIQTSTGILFDPLRPDYRLISIYDIAHSLSNQCRFTGHTRSPVWWWPRDAYTIAEHSVHVAELTPSGKRLCALLHDGTEAYISDLASPFKRSDQMTFYRNVEQGLWEAIAQKWDLPRVLPPEVHTADRYMVGIEARDLMAGTTGLYWRDLVRPIAMHPLRVTKPWSARKSKRKFLEMYNLLLKEENYYEERSV